LLRLEDRTVPATVNVPWPDSTHLTLSFAPDGTAIAGHQSDLFSAMNANLPRATWQREILRAAQTWAAAANVSVGVVSDGGQPFGTPGLNQGDSRFGDIRVGGQPMAAGALAVSVPHDPFLSGTWSGDVLFNTAIQFKGNSGLLYSVALHEFGHVFGLEDNTDPASAMYNNAGQIHTGLSAGDVAAVQSLYGARAPDANEGSGGNDTPAKATHLSAGDGTIPAVAFSDVTTVGDVDYFAVQPPSGYQGGMTVRVQSTGVGLLAPKVTVTDSAGNVFESEAPANPVGATLTVVVKQADPTRTYFVRVEGATADVFGVGRYGLAVTFPARSTVPAATLDLVLRGPYDGLSPSDLAQLLRNPGQAVVNDDGGADDTEVNATRLAPTRGGNTLAHYGIVASLATAADVDFYRFSADVRAGAANVLTASVAAVDANGTVPRLQLFDRDLQPVPSQVLTNGNGTFTVQATGLTPQGNYYLRVAADPAAAHPAGNYTLSLDLGGRVAVLNGFTRGEVPVRKGPADVRTLYVARPQLFQFLLAAEWVGPASAAAVQMTITDLAGTVLYSLTARVGDVASGPAVLLTPGEYRVRFTAVGGTGLTFTLRGGALTDPIGPALSDPTLAPRYLDPASPSRFLYPGDVFSDQPFLWVTLALSLGK
jgi:hypothetical protein